MFKSLRKLMSCFPFANNTYKFYLIAILHFFVLSNTTWGQIAQRGDATSSLTTNTTLTISKPLGLMVGDLMITQIVQSGNNNNVSSLGDATSPGWTTITSSDIRIRNGNYNHANILYKIATSSDVSSSNFTFTLDLDSDDGEGAIIAFYGVNTSNPFDVTPGSNYDNISNDNRLNADAITIVNEFSAIIMFGAFANDRNVNNWPTGFTELYDVPYNAARDMGMAAAVQYNVSAGSTGDKTANLSGNAFNGSILIALRPTIETTPPSCSTPVSPDDGSTNVAANSNLSWNSVFGATGYRIYFGTDASATNIENGTDLGNATSYIPSSNLSGLTNYYWKIVPYNTYGLASGCSIWSFTSEDKYCTPTYTTGSEAYGDFISLVQLGDINNSTGASASPYYTYYNTFSTDLTLGGSYTITLGSGTYFEGNNISVWIDYDQSGTFETSEKLGNVTLAGNSTGTINFLIPSDGLLGQTRMRVRETWNLTNLDPCQEYIYGETEDYNVNITLACNDATLTLNTGNSNQTVCLQQSITDIEFTVGGSATGATVTGLPTGVSGNFVGGTVTISGAPAASGTFNYTVTTTGTPVICSEATELGTITVNPLPSSPSANNVISTYNGSIQNASANVGAGEIVDWYTAESGGIATNAPSGTNAGVYAAWAEARNTTTGCVSLSRTQVTLTINKKNLQVTAVAPNTSYGDAEPAVTVQYNGFVGSDDETVLDNIGFVLGTDYVQGYSVGTYNTTILIGSATDNNYNFSPLTNSTFLVGKNVLTVTAGNQTVTYGSHFGDVTLNGTYTIAGFVNGDNSSVISGLSSIIYATNYTETTNAGTSGITITPNVGGLSAVNYNFSAVDGTITITKADQFVSFGVPSSKPLNEFETILISTFSSSGLPVIITMEPLSAATLNEDPPYNYFLTNIGTTGTVTLYGNQPGNNNYNAATLLSRIFDVTKSNQSISFPAIDDVNYFTGMNLQLEAVASSALPISYTVESGPATIIGNILTITGAGEVWVRANQPGDEAFNAAASVLQAFTVNKGTQTITINIPSEPLTESTQITATSNSGLPVALTLGTGSAATGLVDQGSYYTLTGIAGTGNIYIVGNQTGNSNFLPAEQIIQTIEIGKSNQTITFNTISNQTYSPSLTVPLNATASSGLTVSFSLISGPATLAGSTLTITGAGTIKIVANQSGNTTYNSAPTVTQQFEVLKATPVIVQADIVKIFGDIDFTITPSSNSSGTFSFISGNDDVFIISGNVATITGTGTATLDITQEPTANYYGTIKTVIFSVSKNSSTISVTGLTDFVYNELPQGPSTATVTGSTGDVSYSYSGTGSTSYGPVSAQPENAGTYEVIATVAADDNYSSATSSPFAFAISKADAVVTVTPYSLTYDGLEHTSLGTAQGVSSENLPGLDLSGTTHTDAGTYSGDSWIFTDVTGNYNDASGTIDNLINPKDLIVTADDQAKCFGETFSFSGIEFIPAGLVNAETIGSVTLNSSGAAVDAVAGTYPIIPSNASGGTFNPSNYSITYINGEIAVNPIPTLTGAAQVAPVCEGNSASIVLSGLLPNSNFNLNYDINSIPQTEILGMVADASGNSIFLTPILTASNNGQEALITSITITGSMPNCTATFSQSVTLEVNPIPTLTSAEQSVTVCEGSAANINLSGLLPNTTFSLSYNINGGAQVSATGLSADASGNSSFLTAVLNTADNGQVLQIVEIEDETSGCVQVFTENVVLAVDAFSVGGTATATENMICENSTTSIVLSGYSGNDIQWEQSPDGINGWIEVIGGIGERAETYITPNLSSKTYYRARVTNGVCALEYSTVTSVDINPLPTLTGAIQSAVVCEGSLATINLSGLLPNTTMTLRYTINNGTPFVVTGMVSDGSGISVFTTQALIADNDGETLQIIEIEVENTGCVQSFTQDVILDVDATSVGGTATANTASICENDNTALQLSGYEGTIQWQQSADGTSGWINVTGGTGETTETYTTPNLTKTTYYRAVVTNGVCSADNSNVVEVTVTPLPNTSEINTN